MILSIIVIITDIWQKQTNLYGQIKFTKNFIGTGENGFIFANLTLKEIEGVLV